MQRNQYWIGGIGILALLGLLPAIASGAPAASRASKHPAAREQVIYSFTGGADGGNPFSDLVLNSAGNLYGTTLNGGTGTACNGGCGTVFELKRNQSGWTEEVLYSFQGGTDGYSPAAGVIFDSSGNLYGTTQFGGEAGTVFKLSPNGKGGWIKTTLYDFSGGGATPASDLVFDTKGNLYGTTSQGGSGSCGSYTGCGTVFELIKQPNGSWKASTLYEFAGPPNDGATPSSGVVLDAAGNLYGLTVAGGSKQCLLFRNPGCGVAYKLTPDGKGNWTETVLFTFARGNGFAVSPSAGLLVDAKGDSLLGTTVGGGDGLGTVFVLNRSNQEWKQKMLHRFYENLDGRQPVGQLAKDSQGNLFGVTSLGGRASPLGHGGNGMVFELQPTKAGPWKEKILYDFAGGSDGSVPSAGVVIDNQGHLYGTTSYGGSRGTVYEITP